MHITSSQKNFKQKLTKENEKHQKKEDRKMNESWKKIFEQNNANEN